MPKLIIRHVVPSYHVSIQGECGGSMFTRPHGARMQVACYLESRPAGTVIDVTYYEHCAACDGSGHEPQKRRSLNWKACKVCKGFPDVYETKLSLEDLMRA